MARVYVSIGSNIHREYHIPTAIRALSQHYAPLTVSTVYESPAVGFAGDDFYNLVVGFDTEQTVAQVKSTLEQIEHDQGRTRNEAKFAARTLDLDLLLYADHILYDQGYDIPRHEITRYAFVLKPLAEIAGSLPHPVNGMTLAALWAEWSQQQTASLTPVILQYS